MARGALGVIGVVLAVVAAPAHATDLGTEGGFTYVKKSVKLADTTDASRDGKNFNVKCPNTFAPTGGGTSVSSDPAGSFVSMSAPRAAQWRSGGWHFGQPPGKVTGWGVCLDERETYLQTSFESVNGGAASSRTEECGEDAVSGGGVRPMSDPEEWWIHSTAPRDLVADLDSEPDDGWQSTVFHQASYPTAEAHFYAICLKDITPVYKAQGVAFTEEPVVTASVECPKRKSVAGGGADVSGPASQVHLVKTQPLDSDDKGKVPDDGWKVTVSNPSQIEIDVVSYAACV